MGVLVSFPATGSPIFLKKLLNILNTVASEDAHAFRECNIFDNNLVVSSTFLFLPFCGEDVGDMGDETALGASPVIIEYQHFVILSPNFLTEDPFFSS